MAHKKTLAGMILSRSRKLRPEMRSALTWLDIKIEEFKMRCNANDKFVNSNRAMIEFSEILGTLKFLYMAEIITVEEFKSIITIITGDEVSTEEVLTL